MLAKKKSFFFHFLGVMFWILEPNWKVTQNLPLKPRIEKKLKQEKIKIGIAPTLKKPKC
jgi:hypothetical protein